MATRLFGIAAVLAATAAVAAGCGGGSEDSSTEAWASGVCTSIATWKAEIEEIASETAKAVEKPATAREAIDAAVTNGVAATEALVSDLQALEPPETPEGQQAKEEIDGFMTTLEATADEVRTTIDESSDAGSLAAFVASLSGLGATLQNTIDEGRELVITLGELGGAIKDGFESAESCQTLRDGA